MVVLILGVMVALVACVLVLSRKTEGGRWWTHLEARRPFVTGYLAALDDIDRGGVRRLDFADRRLDAETAFERIYITHEPPETKEQLDRRVDKFLAQPAEHFPEDQ